MWDDDTLRRVVGLGVAAVEAVGDFGFGDFVGSADGDRGGGTAEEGDVVKELTAAVDGDAEAFECIIDGW